jgi:formamidase
MYVLCSLLLPLAYGVELTTHQNRWHPDNPSYGTIKPNEVVKIECVDWTGGQIGNNDSADDMRDVDLTKIHYLTGPFDIEGA